MGGEIRPDREDKPAPSGGASEAEDSQVSESVSGFGVNAALVEEIRQRYEVDPSSVHESWAEFFEKPDAAAASAAPPAAAQAAPEGEPPRAEMAAQMADKHARVLRLIHSYRARGHRIADTDPLGGQSRYFPELDPAHYGFGSDDLDRPYIAGDLPGGSVQTLRQILERLRATYCRKVGVEFTHVQDPGRKAWLQRRLEDSANVTPFKPGERLHVLQNVAAAELFERFLHTKFVGQKRFSLEGAESLIPLLDTIVEDAPAHGAREIVLGMAHRGRLNVLSNTLRKSLESIFSEFEDNPLINSPFGSGDVKYHKGYSNDRVVRTGQRVHLSLTANPSHLEAVDPVVEGRARAKQRMAGDLRGESVIPVLIHGDAAFAGQGMVAETLNLSNLAGYSTGGTIHVIVNNQIGFTTTPAEARSTLYASDVAKMIQVPILHVNGDEPEAVVHCVKIAMEWRQRFLQDVVIDMVCYRRHGHNEGDEPSFTQPLLYEKIRRKESVRKLYTDQLIASGILQHADVERIEADLSAQLRQALERIDTRPTGPDEPLEPSGPWRGFSRTEPETDPVTSVAVEQLAQIAERLATTPSGFAVHPKLSTMLERRRKVVAENGPIDWGLGEALAFGTLLVEGSSVRLSGQDSCRGTFSHRHAAIVDQKTGEEYVPLAHLSPQQARFEAYDSLLSEAAVLGFEYGYSGADPATLTIWEAQFGDFANGAQAIIDQFIVSAHVKWQRMSGLVMLLPHGYEGQGPEHSSARIERFLTLCAEDNMRVCYPSTPASYFHLLRRQGRDPVEKPLVVFTPKSLLRHPRCVSSLPELAQGSFAPLLEDALAEPARVRRVVLTSGKLYYDLQKAREERKADQVALVRVEQLYPFPAGELGRALARYSATAELVWAQEEPRNMGAWRFVRERFLEGDVLVPGRRTPAYAGRADSASPAAGVHKVHVREQEAVVRAALGV
jgi:2-oxoglutarate dehydrogenase E1 component